MLLWPARIVTPTATYEPAYVRAEHNVFAEVVTKEGEVVERLEEPIILLVAEGAATGMPHVVQRWRLAGGSDRWLAEVVRSCGCGSTRITGANPAELAW